MQSSSTAFIIALPHAISLQTGQRANLELAGMTLVHRTLRIFSRETLETQSATTTFDAAFASSRLAGRIAQEDSQGSVATAEKAFCEADLLVFLIPAGRLEDHVWAPIITDLLRKHQRNRKEPGRKPVLAWTGIEHFLPAYGMAAQGLARHGELGPTLAPLLARSAPELSEAVHNADASQSITETRLAFLTAHDTTGEPLELILA